MVNTNKLKPPEGDDLSEEERLIPDGPLEPLSKIQEVAKQGRLIPVTNKCIDDIERLGWSADEEVRELVLQLRESNYHRSEWCKISIKKNLVACDAYTIERYEKYTDSGSSYLCKYYLKFAIGPMGDALLMVSCHDQRKS